MSKACETMRLPGFMVVEDLRTQPQVDVGEQIHRHHVGLAKVLLEQVGDLEFDLVGDAGRLGVARWLP